MILVIRQFIAIMVNTVLTIIRQPLIMLMTTVCLVLTGLLSVVVMFNFGEQGKLVRDGALAFHFVFGLLVANVAASASLYREIKGGTAATVLCKPVSRDLFFLSTYCGIILTLFLFSLMAMMTSLISVRMTILRWNIDWWAIGFLYGALLTAYILAGVCNFRFKRSFASHVFIFLIPALLVAFLVEACLNAECHFVPFGSLIQWRMLPAEVLIFMAIAVLAAIAISFSTRLPPVFTLVLCMGLFFLGLISDYLFGQACRHSFIAAFCYDVLPNWQDFWMIDALSGGGIIPWSYVAEAGVYAVLIVTGVLGLGLISFRNVEIH